jgi:hypothetical protein
MKSTDGKFGSKQGDQGSMRTIFGGFCQFLSKKLAFFSKTNVMIKILHISPLFWLKNANFFAEFFLRKYFLNHNIGPRLGEFSPIWLIVYFGQLIENYRSSPDFCATFFPRLRLCINFDNRGLGFTLGVFSKTNVVALKPTSKTRKMVSVAETFIPYFEVSLEKGKLEKCWNCENFVSRSRTRQTEQGRVLSWKVCPNRNGISPEKFVLTETVSLLKSLF